MKHHKHDIIESLGKKVVLLDGGMGSMLIAAGLKEGHPPEEWNLSNSESLARIHSAYLDAGAEVIQANTFGATRVKLDATDAGRSLDAGEVNEAGARIAREAIDEFGHEGRFLAGDIGPTGQFFPPVGRLDASAARAAFAEQANALANGGADFFLIETMYDIREALEAVRGIREVSDLPVIALMTYEKKAKGYFTLMGDTPAAAVEALCAEGAAAVGANCTLTSVDMIDLVPEIRELTNAPIVFQPNAGKPVMEHGRAVYRQRPEEFAADIATMVKAGAGAVGGCCGTTPDFIRAVHDRLIHGA